MNCMRLLYPGLVCAGLSLMVGGCGGDLDTNEGFTKTTAPGEAIQQEWLLAKWDVDGERTNTANGQGGVGAIPADVVTDVLGTGWRFRQGGVLEVDAVVGTRNGTWSLSGNTLTVKDPGGATHTYDASFRDGFLYLQDKQTKRWTVFERGKFFGF